MQRRTFWSRFGFTLLGVLPASLFVGLMLATAGFALHPPIVFPAAQFVCDGSLDVESRSYSYRPGERSVSRTLWCVTDGGAAGKPAREDVTSRAMLAAFLVYSAVAFAVLQLLGWLVWRRIAGSFKRAAKLEAARQAAGIDFSSLLSQVGEAVRRGDARVTVHNRTFDLRDGGLAEARPAGPEPASPDPPGPDPAERLERLRRLYDEGLINAAEYQAKRLEILAGL